VPGGEGIWPHPHAFLLGDAADAVSLWPGRELLAAAQGARSLVHLLTTIHQCLRSRWPVQDSMLRDHDETMALLQAQEARACMRQLVLPGSAEARREAGPLDREAFFTLLRDSHARLANAGLPEERASELPRAASLCQKLLASGLSLETQRLLKSTGSWVPEAWEGKAEPAPVSWRGMAAADDVDQDVGTGVLTGTAQQEPGRTAGQDAEDGDARREARIHYNRGVRLLKGKGVVQDEAKAAAAFLEAARRGHREAQYALGSMYLSGKGIKQNQKQAARWFTLAAEKDHAKAQYNLGIMYQYGAGLQRDVVAASNWTLRAAHQGHRRAMKSGLILSFGLGDWIDYDHKEMGVEAILKEAEGGNSDAQYKMGTMFYDGDGVEQDKVKASFWFMQAARQGLAVAQFQMSRMLFFGDGIEADPDYAFRFLALAAEQGHVPAQHNLGVKLYFGEGIGSDKSKAAYWFLKAANEGFAESQNNIGWMLFLGDGVQRNAVEGRRWLTEAAERGNAEAQFHLQSIEGRPAPW